MYEFKYDIKKRKDGRPYIHFPDDFEDIQEHRFMTLEFTTYLLDDLYQRFSERHSDQDGLHDQSMKELNFVIEYIAEISNNTAFLIKESMDSMDEVKEILNNHNKDNKEEND